MRRIVSGAAAAALLSTLVFAGGVAAGPPIGGCPTGAWWELRTPQHQPHPADLNGDGKTCRLESPPGSGLFTVVDNNVREL